MMEPKISLVMVTFNESRFLAESLNRLSFCDEMIVIDLGSSDDSAKIAEAAGAKVYQHQRVNFAEQVQDFGIQEAAHDWILFADPDLYFPENIGPQLKKVIAEHAHERLGAIHMPILNFFGGRALWAGRKGGIHLYRAVINRHEFALSGLLHHRGKTLKPGATELRLSAPEFAPIEHRWIDSLSDVIAKSRRYLPFEGESRYVLGQRFSWNGLLREMGKSLKEDLYYTRAWKDWRAIQLMFFQVWYIWNAHMSLRAYCRIAQRKVPL